MIFWMLNKNCATSIRVAYLKDKINLTVMPLSVNDTQMSLFSYAANYKWIEMN